MTQSNQELIARIELHTVQIAALAVAQGIPLEYFADVFATNLANIELLKAITPEEELPHLAA